MVTAAKACMAVGGRFEEATHRTTRWIDRCMAAHARPHEQNLFGIVQGGLDPELRRISLQVSLGPCSCYSITSFWRSGFGVDLSLRNHSSA